MTLEEAVLEQRWKLCARTMSADSLPLPSNVLHALRIKGMREVVFIHRSGGRGVRWDTVIDGEQRHIEYVPEAQSHEDLLRFAASYREAVRQQFLLEAMHG